MPDQNVQRGPARQTRGTAASGRSGKAAKPKRSRGRTWARRILLTLVALGLLGVIGVLTAYALVETPKPNDLATAQASIVYYSDGKTEMARIGEVNRESVPLKQVPVQVRQAFLAAEDRQFYSNQGISITGIGRAVWGAIRGGGSAIAGGGSTITQQYVRNYFLTQDRTLTRKVKEILISVKIDGQESKDQILENYLNTVYFGRGAYGIDVAAQHYYGKNPDKLTPAEGAFLAAAVNQPSYLDPGLGAENKAAAERRWNYVMDGMVSEGWLTPQERSAAKFPMPKPYKPKAIGGTAGYIVEYAKNELRNRLKLTDSDIDRGGLRIVTTVDRAKMTAASEAVKDQMPKDTKEPLHVGLVSIKPGDGAIQALYGGADYLKRQRSTATQDGMQSGSTFKIFTLIAALQSGDVSIKNTFNGTSPLYFKEFADDQNPKGRVENFGNTPEGIRDLRGATALSTNTIFAALNIIATPKKTVDAAHSAGVKANLEANYANVFGTNTVTVLDMASAYATIAAQGTYAQPYVVKSVASADRTYDYKAVPKTSKVFDTDLMRDVIYCMTGPVQFGTATYVGNNLGRPAAGKTGTTSDNYSAWFDGFVPQLATAVGIYMGDGTFVEKNRMNNIPGVGELTGATTPTYLWTEYMKKALEGVDIVQFPAPAYINAGAKPSLGTQRPTTRRPPPPPPTSSAPPTTSSAPAPTSSTPAPTTSAPPPTTTAPAPTTSAPASTTVAPTATQSTATSTPTP